MRPVTTVELSHGLPLCAFLASAATPQHIQRLVVADSAALKEEAA